MRAANLPIIFDVEGTLIDCVPQTLESWRETLREFGHSFRLDELQPYSGMDGSDMLRCLVPGISAPETKRLLQRQGSVYRKKYLNLAKAIPHVRETFRSLRNVGAAIAIATTCQQDELAVYDERMNALNLADAVVCGDEVKQGKPHPDLFRKALQKLMIEDPSNAIAVGDTPYDAQAALSIGAKAIGVLTGGFSRAALQSAGCHAVADSVRAVVPMLIARYSLSELPSPDVTQMGNVRSDRSRTQS